MFLNSFGCQCERKWWDIPNSGIDIGESIYIEIIYVVPLKHFNNGTIEMGVARDDGSYKMKIWDETLLW